MKIIISPAKKMNVNTDVFACPELPVFLDRTKELMEYIKKLSYEDAKNFGLAMIKLQLKILNVMPIWIWKKD